MVQGSIASDLKPDKAMSQTLTVIRRLLSLIITTIKNVIVI